LGLFLNAHQNSTLMPLVQEDKSLIHFLVLHEKHEEYQISTKNTNLVEENPMNVSGQFGSILFSGFRKDHNVFSLAEILKIFSSETTKPIEL
jgi:hypothetical protein